MAYPPQGYGKAEERVIRPGESAFYEDTALHRIENTDWTQVKEVTANIAGKYRIKFDLVSDSSMYIAVLSAETHKLYKYRYPAMELISEIGSQGSGNDQFNAPLAMDIWYDWASPTEDPYLIIADTNNHRIQKRLATDLSFVASVGTQGNGDDQFNAPRDVGVNIVPEQIVIADTNNHRIMKRDAETLAYIAKIGTQGAGNDQFDSPRGICAYDDDVYVADASNHRIVKRSMTDLSYVDQVGSLGSGNDQFTHPDAVAYSIGATSIIVSDTTNSRLNHRDYITLAFRKNTLKYGFRDEYSINYVRKVRMFLDYHTTPWTYQYLVADEANERILAYHQDTDEYLWHKDLGYKPQCAVPVDHNISGDDIKVYARIYKNGSPVGTERVTDIYDYTTYSEDIDVDEGDKIQLYTKLHHARGGGTLKNLQFCSGEGTDVVSP